MRLRQCPPISVLTTPYAFTPPPLPCLCSHGALLTFSQHHLSLHLCSALMTSSRHCLPYLHSRSALTTCSRHHLSLRLCSALPTSLRLQRALPTCSRHHLSLRSRSALPTPLILTLAECPPDTTYPYACGVHSRHAPDTTYPYACVVPSRHAPDTTYPYARGVPPNMLSTRLSFTLV
ncbi:hypothetical protein O181_017272 [Austropuccinia psidii MF-1]|uniref:Uncharacterized protein n=1 Tax=Austropuccinia psidii MF-1 TaxID=1389203 RepID=A0A9Q3C7A6_9BASI|nr:hypothetical protein [Austropuccinia psidii MF-1]